MKQTRIVRVGNLAEFTQEIGPRQLVRLSLTDRWLNNTIPTKSVELHLQGINILGEIVWLMEASEVAIIHGTPRDRSIHAGMERVQDFVHAHLLARGYRVRPGSYGLPDDIKPVNGHFEIVRWTKNDDGTYTVATLNSADTTEEQDASTC